MATCIGGVPAHNVFQFDGVTFSANFDNGNLARVEQVPNKSFEFKIWTAPDNLGTTHQSKHCAWYYFMVTGLPQGCVLRLQIVNTSNHSGLYKYDMRPVYRSNTTNQKWVRIKSSVRFSKESGSPQLFFEHGVDAPDDKLYFAFTYPYTYTMVQNELDELDAGHANNFSPDGSIYYKREVITRSLDNRRIDLLTITSADGASTTDREPLLSSLFPDAKTVQDRPLVFPDKEVVFISARVHPGEVPAQHTFKGILNLLMDPNDLRAKELRARYVFKLIPMLNPDGVYRGHFRMDQLGQNLNRYYINSNVMIQPSIFAAKSLTDYYAAQGKLAVYLDFHAHASKRGCFIYGNVLDSAEDQIQNQLYCKLIAMNSAHFDYEGCLFSKDHMTRIDPGDQAKGLSAEGSGRVSMYLAHGIIHSYTIECNYNTSRVGNEIAPTDTDPCGAAVTPASPFTTNPEKYTPNTFAGVGRACVIALLDIRGHNPCSRISKSKFKTLDRVRNSVMMEVRSRKEYIGKAVNRQRRRSIVALERKVGSEFTMGSADDLCWRRVIESADPTVPSSSSGPSPVPQSSSGGQNSGKNSDTEKVEKSEKTEKLGKTEKGGDVFFVSMKEGKEPRRRRRSASAVQAPAPLGQAQLGGAGTGVRGAVPAGPIGASTSMKAESQTQQRGVKSSILPTVPIPATSSRPAIRTESNSNYVASNAFTPHLGYKSMDPTVAKTVEQIMRDTSPNRNTTFPMDIGILTAQPDSRSSTPMHSIAMHPPLVSQGSTPLIDPKELGLQTTAILPPNSKRERGNGSIINGEGTVTSSSSSSSKPGRNLLGKKLHAAGVALVMGNNTSSFSSLERAMSDAKINSSTEALEISPSKLPRAPAALRPASSGTGSNVRNRDVVVINTTATVHTLHTEYDAEHAKHTEYSEHTEHTEHSARGVNGIAVQDEYVYLSQQHQQQQQQQQQSQGAQRLSPAARDPFSPSPVKSIRASAYFPPAN